MKKTDAIELGGQTFALNPSIRRNKAWREKFSHTLDTWVFPALKQLPHELESIELTNIDQLKQVVAAFGPLLLQAPDTLLELLEAYVPELKEKHEWILDNAQDEELVRAFVEVLKSAFPLESIAATLSGLLPSATRTNLPSASGAGGLTN